jgi:hypothetical protein
VSVAWVVCVVMSVPAGDARPSGRTHLVRIVVAVARGHTQGEVLRVLLNDVCGALDRRLHEQLPDGEPRQRAQAAGADKVAVDVLLRADTHAQALVSAGVAAATVCELAHAAGAGLDFGHVALVVREQAAGADAFA